MLFPSRPSHFSHSSAQSLSILFLRRDSPSLPSSSFAQIRSSGAHGRSSIRELVGQKLGMELYGAEEQQQQQQQPCCRLSSTKKRSGGKGRSGKSGRPSFSGRCARLVKEQRARFYIMRRCVTMLVCWRDYA